jgi:hypothetical protein
MHHIYTYIIYTYRYRRSAILLIHDPNVTVAPTAMMVWGLRWEFLIAAATNVTPIHLEYFKGFKSLDRNGPPRFDTGPDQDT